MSPQKREKHANKINRVSSYHL